MDDHVDGSLRALGAAGGFRAEDLRSSASDARSWVRGRCLGRDHTQVDSKSNEWDLGVVARGHVTPAGPFLQDVVWGLRVAIQLTLVGATVGTVLMALGGTDLVRELELPVWRIALGYGIGTTCAGVILGAFPPYLKSKVYPRVAGGLIAWVVLTSLLLQWVLEHPGYNGTVVMWLIVVTAPIIGVPGADGVRAQFKDE
jgi:hypothetical protein